MSQEYAIELKGVSKIYTLKSKDKKNKKGQSFYALKEISAAIPKGEVVGVLGSNGSGKSTLSLILAGISSIDEGTMSIQGEQALIAINTGLNKQLTGVENIELKGALLGLKKKEIEDIKDRVIDFAELGDFLYQPVKKYSSGMKSRLGFAINLALDPDIFIVDEALSVGDKGFTKKCLDKMTELKKSGKTIVFISHSLPQMKKFCDTAIWIEGGILKEYGTIGKVSKNYETFVKEYQEMSKEEKEVVNHAKYNKRIKS